MRLGQWVGGGLRAETGVLGQSDPVATIDMPTHTSTPNPVAGHGMIQDSPGNLDTRRQLLVALAVMRARQGRGGAGTQRRLAGLGMGGHAADVQHLSDHDYQGLLALLTQHRQQPSSPRYGGLFG